MFSNVHAAYHSARRFFNSQNETSQNEVDLGLLDRFYWDSVRTRDDRVVRDDTVANQIWQWAQRYKLGVRFVSTDGKVYDASGSYKGKTSLVVVLVDDPENNYHIKIIGIGPTRINPQKTFGKKSFLTLVH